MRQGSGKKEMHERKIPVGLDGTTEPRDCFLVGAKMQLGGPGEMVPQKDPIVARRETKRLVDMCLGFLGATDKNLAQTDLSVRACP